MATLVKCVDLLTMWPPFWNK